MKNPISDNDLSMFPDRPEILENAKNATSRGLMNFLFDWGTENFGRRVRVGTWFNRSMKTFDPKSTISLTDRERGYRYIIEIGGDPDDWDLDPEYTLEPFKRSFLGFRVVRNK